MNSNVYFSLGEAIAVLGIIIAVYGVVKTRWRLNFTLNRRFFLSVLSLLCLGLTSAFTSFIFAAYLDQDAVALSLQGAAFLFFVFAAIDFVRGAFWKKPLFRNKYKEKRKVEFVRKILDELLFARSEDQLNAVISIIHNSLDEICKDISSKIANRQDSDNVGAYLLDTLLGERRVANHIAENRLDFIDNLIFCIKKHKLRGFNATLGVDNLLTALYVNQKSYFYQQVGYDGLTNYASAYKIIFENDYFIREYGPIANWYNVSQKVNFGEEIKSNVNFVEVFLKGYMLALEKFAYTHPSLTQELARGMYRLADYAEDASHEIRRLSEYDYFAPPSRAFHEIVRFASHSFYYDIFQKKADAGQIETEELRPSLESEQYRENLSSAFCRLFTDLAEAIVSMHDKDEHERMHVHDLNEIFVHSIGSYSHVAGLRAKILHDLWRKSNDNIKHGHFPAVFRALVIMLYWRHNGMPQWAKDERNKLIDTLRNDLKPRILRNEMMANRRTLKEEALLPPSIVFDRSSNKFYTVDANDNRSELRKT